MYEQRVREVEHGSFTPLVSQHLKAWQQLQQPPSRDWPHWYRISTTTKPLHGSDACWAFHWSDLQWCASEEYDPLPLRLWRPSGCGPLRSRPNLPNCKLSIWTNFIIHFIHFFCTIKIFLMYFSTWNARVQLKYKAKRLNCQDDEVRKIVYQDLEQGCSYDYSSCEWPHPPSFAFNPMMLLTLTKGCVQRLQISSVQLRTCTVITPRGYYALQLSRECHEFILPPALAPWTAGNPYHPFPLRLLENHLFQATTTINLWPQSNWIGQAI